MRTDSPGEARKEQGPGGVHLAGAEGHPGLSRHTVSRIARRGQSHHPHIPTLRHRLSEERLDPYDRAAGGDHTASLRLYEWNMAVSAAFFESLHVLEVVLRNAFHEQLAGLYRRRTLPGPWYEQPRQLLSAKACDEVEKARERLRVSRKPESAGRVVAELSFGFWRYLTATRYAERLWRPALRQAFQTSDHFPGRRSPTDWPDCTCSGTGSRTMSRSISGTSIKTGVICSSSPKRSAPRYTRGLCRPVGWRRYSPPDRGGGRDDAR